MLRVAEHFERTDTGRQRSANEDSYFARPPLFAVADGMGGAQSGEVASRTAIEEFQRGLPADGGSTEERLAGLVARANSRIHEIARTDEQHAGMGTTLTAAYVGEDDVAVAHVGDSRLYCLRDGRLEQRTDDHSLVGELVRRGQLSAEEAEDHPQRSIITRALGPEGDVDVDHHSWPARDGDVFLICSDGLTSMITDERVADIIMSAGSLADAGRSLVEAANEAGGRDNITVILFRIEELTPGAGALAAPRDAGEEQPTRVGQEMPTAAEVREAAAVAQAEAPSAPSATQPRMPRAPRPAPAQQKRRKPWPAPVKAAIVVLVLLAMVGSGAWIASRGVYFVGTDDNGFVTLYQGLPYDAPAGLSLYQRQFTSGVPAGSLPPAVRKTVTEHKLRSHDDAISLVREIERGELAGQR
jgi:serine/threonine protein phosphatase PrpC